jgi:hypothetical protein
LEPGRGTRGLNWLTINNDGDVNSLAASERR